ncbi:isochorismatase family protein [Kribbella antiqua]|uniref:Isochorismatase family protein n=1 Tax=Kribbella antiqua TaxID=2512217 RepID=A0A4R2IHT5_9ACTN|nr:isochorismatase family protein [Kribbella antiqua]
MVLVQVGFSADGADRVPGRVEQATRSTGTPPPNATNIVDELAGYPEDIVVTKRNWGAFYGTDLDDQLGRRGITHFPRLGETGISADVLELLS